MAAKNRPLIKSPIPRWIGSKRTQLKYLLPIVPPYALACEVFGGADWLSFNIEGRRVVNDRDPELINVYRQIAENGESLARKLYFSVSSRHLLALIASSRDERPFQRAYRFLYINKTGFNARMWRPTYAVRKKTAAGNIFSFAPFARHIRACQAICRDIEFSNLPWQQALSAYDDPETFFYLDPPYPGCERYYGPGMFDLSDFNLMADALAKIQGKFLLSLPADEKTLALFSGFRIREIPVIYLINNIRKTRAREYVIANYDLPAIIKPSRIPGSALGQAELMTEGEKDRLFKG
ncbi:MAG: DNA adenine methylase [Desulfovibrio sp.]|nr:DNA adenine methylase [Desulfovibrio sp.]